MIFNNQIKQGLLKGIILGFFLAPTLATAADAYYYKDMGHIFKLEKNAISLRDRFYTYSPTVKVFKLNGERSTIDSLKKGEFVELTILNMDNKDRVDTIKRISESDAQVN